MATKLENLKPLLDQLSEEQRQEIVGAIESASKQVPSWVWMLGVLFLGGGTGLLAVACKAICGCEAP